MSVPIEELTNQNHTPLIRDTSWQSPFSGSVNFQNLVWPMACRCAGVKRSSPAPRGRGIRAQRILRCVNETGAVDGPMYSLARSLFLV